MLIHQFSKMSSTEMLKKINKNITFDFIHFDGRILHDDLEYIKNFLSNNTVFIFDDFINIEKGVVNYFHLIDNKIIDRTKYLFIMPPERKILDKFNLKNNCTTALAIPFQLIKFKC